MRFKLRVVRYVLRKSNNSKVMILIEALLICHHFALLDTHTVLIIIKISRDTCHYQNHTII